MTDTKITIDSIIDKPDDALYAFRHTCEQVIEKSAGFHPMLTFYAASDEPAITIVVDSSGTTFQHTLARLAEALYLYAPLKAHAVLIAINSDINNEDGKYIHSSLNVFTLSDLSAFVTSMPYTVTSTNQVTWLNDQFTTENILDKNFDGLSKEMVNLFYMLTHIDGSPYTVQELLSYLSYVGAAIQIHNDMNISFYDMTPQKNG